MWRKNHQHQFDASQSISWGTGAIWISIRPVRIADSVADAKFNHYFRN